MLLAREISTAKGGASEPLLISIVGRVDVGNALAFERRLQRVAEGVPRQVLIDFNQCEYVDSVALAILMKFIRTTATATVLNSKHDLQCA